MIIEDEEGVRNLLSDILKKGGHEVETATSGSQGIEIYKKNEFDLVFTDGLFWSGKVWSFERRACYFAGKSFFSLSF